MVISVVIVPWLGFGHVTPHFELAKKLSKCKTINFNVHFVSTRAILDFLKQTKSQKMFDELPNLKLVELQLPTTPGLPPHLHAARGLPRDLWPSLVNAYKNSGSSFLELVNKIKPNLIIYDQLQSWAPEVAKSLGIPAIQMLVESAASMSFYYHLCVYDDNITNYPFPEIFIPNHQMEQLRIQAQNTSSIAKYLEELYMVRITEMSTDIVLANQWEEPERKYMDYLSSLCKKRVVSVGPLISQTDHDQTTKEEESDDFKQVMLWLDTKTKSSTVYATFGSEAITSKEEIQEIAHGLELSDANFLWVVKPPEGEKTKTIQEILPQGFLHRVRGRGLVMDKWVPHAKIMSHPSIGGFMNHCGWNSSLECMYFGLPMIAMPIIFDQYLVARYLHGLGIAVEIKRSETGELIREDIAKTIKDVISDKKLGGKIREKARELSLKVRKEEAKEIDGWVEELLKLCSNNNNGHC